MYRERGNGCQAFLSTCALLLTKLTAKQATNNLA